MKFVSAGDAQPILIQRFSVLGPPDKCPHLRNFGQMRGIQAANRTATNNTDSLDQIAPARSTPEYLSSVCTERISSPFFQCADVQREPSRQTHPRPPAASREKSSLPYCVSRR